VDVHLSVRHLKRPGDNRDDIILDRENQLDVCDYEAIQCVQSSGYSKVWSDVSWSVPGYNKERSMRRVGMIRISVCWSQYCT
jgi:hypothetical protein